MSSIHNVSIIYPAVIDIYVKNWKRNHIVRRDSRSWPSAISICSIAIIPVILKIVGITSGANNATKTAVYVDDLSATGKNYFTKALVGDTTYPQPWKSWLIVKENAKREVSSVIKRHKNKISFEGQRHLGAVIGSYTKYVQNKINELIKEVKVLLQISTNWTPSILLLFGYSIQK